MKSILTIGEILVEIMATEKGDGFLEPINLIGPFPSGAPAIFIDQAAKFGQPAAIIGCVGADDFGRVNLDRLRRDGVDVEGVRIDPEMATGSAFVRYRPDGSRAFVYNIKHSAAGSHFPRRRGQGRSEPRRPPSCDGHGALLAEYRRGHSRRRRSDQGPGRHDFFRPKFAPRDSEPARPSRGLRNLIPTLRSLPAERGRALSVHESKRREGHGRGKSSTAAFGRSFTSAAPTALAITTPRRGSPSAGFEVKEVDPTGAGDCFGATFVSCWLRNMPPAQCLAYAAASGALAVTRQGPMEGAVKPG